jgi:murein L,D-transpeptidase YafK
MKTTIILTSMLVAGSFLFNHTKSTSTTKIASYTVTKSVRSVAPPLPPLKIIIDKSDYELSVYDSKGWYATYPVVFGNDPMKDKRMEGDKYTPEGNFKIVAKKPHDKWSRFLLIDYPNQESLAKFNERKQKGEIPKTAKPGGGVGIHGTWPKDDYMIDRYNNWTLGCISLKNADVKEIYGYVPVGTPVTIRK